ncbi:MAG: HEAT repeat domain-containing protein, partial [Balneolaceae bacterium]
MNTPEAEEASPERIRSDLNLDRFSSQMNEINTCAPCHSLRQKLTDEYIHGDNYLDHFDPQLITPDNYFPDGQIRGEVYVYGSFLQSKMFSEGVQCSDCHNPHTLELKEPLINNGLCMQCHEPEYDSVEHHFHEANTEGSQCINCHMGGRTYMGNDFRRDHSFRVPRPDQSQEFGTPNACNSCHTDRSADWASQAVEEWYGEDRADHFSDVLLRVHEEGPGNYSSLKQLINDVTQPEIIRATAVWYVGQFPEDGALEILSDAIESESAMIRSSAAKVAENLPVDERKPLLEKVLNDSVRSVRIFAMSNL